jgi:predicted N-formylglutamate amidohydrolase
LLGPGDPPPVELVNAAGTSSVVLVCDHASNRVPRGLGTLGLDPVHLSDHIAWDPGAAEVARTLAAELDATLVLSGYSRLVIDCNRPLQSEQSIAESSAGIPVPGNCGLSTEQREIRITELFQPYHDAIERLLDSRAGRPSVLLSIHSFTPDLNGAARPWHIGISHGRDGRLATLLRHALTECEGLVIGDNEPYPIENAVDYTIPVHGEGRGLPSAMIEIRQDGARTRVECAAWAARLAQACRSLEVAALGMSRGDANPSDAD